MMTCTKFRHERSETIWLNVFRTWLCALREIVGVHAPGIAVTDIRFLVEIRGIKAMGGKILHLEAFDQQANIAPELRGHRSEVELNSPVMKMLRDSYIFNEKNGVDRLKRKGDLVLQDWGWILPSRPPSDPGLIADLRAMRDAERR